MLKHKQNERPKTLKEKIYRSLIVRSWWVHLFLVGCYLLYAQGIRKKERTFSDLNVRLEILEREKQEALAVQEDLLLQINSQKDPAWIQMMLMKNLGVVPEGQVKVYFKKEEAD